MSLFLVTFKQKREVERSVSSTQAFKVKGSEKIL